MNTLTTEFVRSMNIIDIEYKDDKHVLDRHASLMTLLAKPHPSNQRESEALTLEQNKAKSALAKELARAIKLNIDRADFHDGGYYPNGWANNEDEQIKLRRLLISVLSGQLSIKTERIRSGFIHPKQPLPPVD